MFAATAVIALIAYAVLYGRVDGKAPIQSDGYSYSVYLPSSALLPDNRQSGNWLDRIYFSVTGTI